MNDVLQVNYALVVHLFQVLQDLHYVLQHDVAVLVHALRRLLELLESLVELRLGATSRDQLVQLALQRLLLLQPIRQVLHRLARLYYFVVLRKIVQRVRRRKLGLQLFVVFRRVERLQHRLHLAPREEPAFLPPPDEVLYESVHLSVQRSVPHLPQQALNVFLERLAQVDV